MKRVILAAKKTQTVDTEGLRRSLRPFVQSAIDASGLPIESFKIKIDKGVRQGYFKWEGIVLSLNITCSGDQIRSVYPKKDSYSGILVEFELQKIPVDAAITPELLISNYQKGLVSRLQNYIVSADVYAKRHNQFDQLKAAADACAAKVAHKYGVGLTVGMFCHGDAYNISKGTLVTIHAKITSYVGKLGKLIDSDIRDSHAAYLVDGKRLPAYYVVIKPECTNDLPFDGTPLNTQQFTAQLSDGVEKFLDHIANTERILTNREPAKEAAVSQIENINRSCNMDVLKLGDLRDFSLSVHYDDGQRQFEDIIDIDEALSQEFWKGYTKKVKARIRKTNSSNRKPARPPYDGALDQEEL